MNAAVSTISPSNIRAMAPTREPLPAIPAEALRLTEDVTLLDGSVVRMRAIRADDDERLRVFHTQLSTESITYRFFRYVPELTRAEARRFTQVDYDQQMALVATQDTAAGERILGVVRYCGLSEEEAEVAFVVTDAWQGHGIATLLFHRLAQYARAHGFQRFIALTLATNTRMLAFFRHCGYPEVLRYQEGEYEVHLDITTSPVDVPYSGVNPYALPCTPAGM